jgi:opacity protein-like surface antigen
LYKSSNVDKGTNMKPPSIASVYRRFRRVAAAAVSAMAFAVPAVAADMPLKTDVVVPPPLWTGFYIGVHGGWGWNRTQIHDLLLSTPPNSFFQTSTDGPIGGGQIGVNWQYNNLVYGIEIDGDVASIRGNVAATSTWASSPPPPTPSPFAGW